MENGLPVYIKTEGCSGFLFSRFFSKSQLIARAIGLFASVAMFITGIVFLSIPGMLLGIFMALYLITMVIRFPSLKTNYSISYDGIVINSKIKKFSRSLSWKQIDVVKQLSLSLIEYPVLLKEDYLIFVAGTMEEEDLFFIHYAKQNNVICIPKTDETVSFVEQFKQIEKESE